MTSPSPRDPAPSTPPTPARRIAIADLMGGAVEVILLHDGQEYRLRITRNGKLILTK